MGSTVHDGGCLCGAIRYRVDGAALRTTVCTCGQCQRQTGSPLPAFVRYPLDRFQLTAGAPAGYRASDAATREFCARCGSVLLWRGDDGGEISILVGTFDQPAAMPAPSLHIFARHAVPWLPALAGARTCPERS